MTQSLYETYKTKWKLLEGMGFPRLAEMSNHFYVMNRMDAALGYSNAVSKWCGKQGARPRADAERRASEWLKDQNNQQVKLSDNAKNATQTFLIICPPENAEKVQKVLGLLGCDFVDV